MKKLPFFTQTFSEIIESDRVYVDKTKYIHRLMTGKKAYFLSRPKRFGKSLLLDVINELFNGRRDLFNGLYIEKSTDYDFPKHPVIKFSMNYAKNMTAEPLKKNIKGDLLRIANMEQLKISEQSYDKILISLLEKLTEKYGGTKVVVLVDECDDPVAKNIGQLPVAQENRRVMDGFYAALKKAEAYLRFVFVVGMTRLAVGSCGGGPDNLVDISLEPEYSGICGFTMQEIEQYFGDRMPETLETLIKRGLLDSLSTQDDFKKRIVRWYDGYNFGSEPRVMNPISIINLFEQKKFSDYWYQNCRPIRLPEPPETNPLDYLDLKLDGHHGSIIKRVQLNGLEPISVLFHSGFLTIDKIALTANEYGILVDDYSFKYPNFDVRASFIRYCLESVFSIRATEFQMTSKVLLSAFLTKDVKMTCTIFKNILGTVMDFQHATDERYFYNLIRIALLGMRFEECGDGRFAVKRSDLALFLTDDVRLVIEFRYRHKTKSKAHDSTRHELAKGLQDAKGALKTKQYAGPWLSHAKKVILMALVIHDRDDILAEFVEE
ncbi:MAG: AAA family ATPase [Deltaproteobacteria bacterium]|nr:AAA family ATPase [Deltaproteobacteria bacterium]